jgi:hypothetical protein
MNLVLLSILTVPFIGFIFTFISSYIVGNKKIIMIFPTVLLFANVVTSIYLFHNIAYTGYHTVAEYNQSTNNISDVHFYTSENMLLDLGT